MRIEALAGVKGVALGRTSLRAPAVDGPLERALRSCVAQTLWTLGIDFSGGSPHALCVDDRHGCGVAETLPELLESALEDDVPRVCWNGRQLDLSEGPRRRLERARRFRLGPAVDFVRGQAVHFRRYRPRLVLNEACQELLRRSLEAGAQGLALDDLTPEAQRLGRELVRQRVWIIECMEDTCTEAGCKSHSSESLRASSRP